MGTKKQLSKEGDNNISSNLNCEMSSEDLNSPLSKQVRMFIKSILETRPPHSPPQPDQVKTADLKLVDSGLVGIRRLIVKISKKKHHPTTSPPTNPKIIHELMTHPMTFSHNTVFKYLCLKTIGSLGLLSTNCSFSLPGTQ